MKAEKWTITYLDNAPSLEVEAESFVKAVEKVKDKLSYASLKGVDLSYANLAMADLSFADLSGAYLSGTSFKGTDLHGADLKGAVLSGTDLSGAYLSGTSFKGVDLSYANLTMAYLRHADLRGACLEDVSLTGANLFETDLSGAYLSGTSFKGTNLHGADLKGAVLSGTDLSGACLEDVNLTGADLEGADFEFCNGFDYQCRKAYQIAKDHGWHEKPCNDGEVLALIHCEISEALQALRDGNKPDHHCPDFSSLEIELADAIIRIMDYAGERGLNLSLAILEKMKFNKKRPYKHGKNF